ncbi:MULTISPECIES: sulfatase-like hydrolase/transferase [unclassified Lacinutrix]
MIFLYDSFKPLRWQEQPDAIENVQLKKTPNIYLIQPDGYVGEEVLSKAPYYAESEIYNWLEMEGFKVYPDFKSNYPATLTSNASMFSMKQHYFGEDTFPSLEMINARDVISGQNPVISILKKNSYATFLDVEIEYFQHNNSAQKYDYRNISLDEIPIFSHGENLKKDVLVDLEEMMEIDSEKPKFFFIERLMPHHVKLYDTIVDVATERDWYLNRLEEANSWLKNSIDYISNKDPEAMIIVLADHGGMVGVDNYKEKYTNDNPVNMSSIFSVLSAIKWNGNLEAGYDTELKSNVNLFRVLFSVLSEDKTYLNNLEENGSYNLDNGNGFYYSVHQAIQSNGDYNLKKGTNETSKRLNYINSF